MIVRHVQVLNELRANDDALDKATSQSEIEALITVRMGLLKEIKQFLVEGKYRGTYVR